MTLFKRIFSAKAPKNTTKSLRVTEPMWKALEELAKEHGESANSFIVMVLDQYLQVQMESGKIKPPPMLEEKSAS